MVEKIVNPAKLSPISSWQQRMISICGNPDCSDAYHDRMLLRWAQLIYPHADERRIVRAFTKLVTRHESLRLRFREVNGE
jgi:hypothetical protein